MSIETHLENLTEAVLDLNVTMKEVSELLRAGAGAQSAADDGGKDTAPPKKTEKPKAEKPKAEEPKAEEAAPEKGATRGDVSKLVLSKVKEVGRDPVVEVLGSFGAAKVSEIKDGDLPAAHAALAALGGGDA
ncbi:hypothetical protein [uncultured Halomonas sp.]|uniref:hypothetical protein n=1 Tax=uncultured Halomonas sp. TaxID=173971 RepID=UPI002621A979|nr:hypothetical protein [uncultured Halomonas sp.]